MMLKPFNRYRATITEQQRKRTLLIWEMLKDICNDEDEDSRGGREGKRERIKARSDAGNGEDLRS